MYFQHPTGNPDSIYEYASRLDYISLKNLCSTNIYFRDLCRTERFSQLIRQKYQQSLQYKLSKLKYYEELVLVWPNRTIGLGKTLINESSDSMDHALLLQIPKDVLAYNYLYVDTSGKYIAISDPSTRLYGVVLQMIEREPPPDKIEIRDDPTALW